jgi:general stress protein YciG
MMNKDKPMTISEMARKGGQAKVPKGFAKMDPERRSELAKKGAKAKAKKRKEGTK